MASGNSLTMDISSVRKGVYVSTPSLTNLCRLSSKQSQCLSGWTQIVPDLGRWMSADFSFLSSFLLANITAMLWSVHARKVPQASKQLCPAKLQTRCGVRCAWQSICPFIHSDSSMARTVDAKKSLQAKMVHGCSPSHTPPFAAGSLRQWKWWHVQSVRHFGRSISVLHVWLLLPPWSHWLSWFCRHQSSYTVLPSCLTVKPHPDLSIVPEPSVYITVSCGLLFASTSISLCGFSS